MSLSHGQLDGRTERIAETGKWLGASPMTDFGEVITEDEGEYEVDLYMVLQQIHTIRCALSSGLGCVRIGERHRPTAVAIANALTDEERRNVIFDLDNVMADEVSENCETAVASERPAKRDIIRRPKRPNVLKVEDGSLRPS